MHEFPPRYRSSWLPAFSMLLVSLISYVDRNTLAILAPSILKETHLNAEQYGFIISCFSVTYMIGNPVWGRILDRWGIRRGMTSAVGLWSIAAAAHAWAGGFWSFAAARAVLGAGEAATFPGGLRTITQTLPPEKRGRGLAIAYSGGSLGAMITPFIVTPIALRFGWHGAFLVTAGFGLLWLLLCAKAGAGVDRNVTASAARIDWRDRALWAFIAAYALGAMPLGFILYGSSLYLSARFHMTQAALGWVLWIPPAGWELGYFVWGAAVDRFGPRFRILMPACMLLSLPFAWMPLLPGPAWVLAELALASFALSGFVVLSISYATRAFSTAHAGLLAGIGAGSWSAVVALTMPYLGRLFDRGDYSLTFPIATVFPVVGYGLWVMLERGRQLRAETTG